MSRMKLQLKFNFFIFFVFLSGSVLALEPYQYIDIADFKSASEIYQKWLKYTAVPESALLLQYPPYIYHTSQLTSDALNLPSLVSDNETLYWDNFEDTNITNAKCSDDLIQVLSNLDTQWALQMLDSDGKLSTGILRGELIWPGFFKECLSVYAPLDEDGHGNFHGQYCVTSWSMHLGKENLNLPLTVGLCVPDSCSGENIRTAMKNSSHILDRLPVIKHLAKYLTLNNVICKAKEEPMDVPTIIYLTIISGFILLTILGSSLTIYDYLKTKYTVRASLLKDNSSNLNYGTLESSESSINAAAGTDYLIPVHSSQNTKTKEVFEDKTDLKPSVIELQNVLPQVQPPVSVIKRILLCFSVFTNGQKILNTEQVEGQLLSIHGIRFLSLSWVILGHTYITPVQIIGNKKDALNGMDSFAFQALLQSTFSVDSFFLLSGFLVTYLYLKEASKKDGKISWLYFYIHRIWRLTPSYIVVVFFYMLVFKHLGSGPFWHDDNCNENRSIWWKYVLYLNNFIPIRDMCVGWSWYLANDMQFYLISPLFLYPLWKWPIAAFAILGSFLIATWTTTGIISYTYDLIPMFVGATQAKDLVAYQDRMWNSFDLIYDKPYCRIGPYIIGALLGYVIYKTGDRKNFLCWWQQLFGWIIAFGCSFSVVYGLYHVEMSRTVSLFYNSLSRSTFVLGLAWLIYACETGHGGFVTKLLSWKLWIPLSRLTYSAYLIHPMIIHGYYQSYETTLHFSEFIMVINFLGFLLISYGLAFAFSLVFESSFMNLEKLIVKRKTT